MTLRFRILLGSVALIAGSFYLVMHMVMSDVRPRYLESLEESTVDIAEMLAVILAEDVTPEGLQTERIAAAMNNLAQRKFLAKIFTVQKTGVSLRVYVTDKQGIIVYDSAGLAQPGTDYSQWRDVYRTLRGQYGARSTRTDPDNPASSTIYIAAPIIKNGDLAGVVTIGKPQDSVTFFIDIAKKRLGFTLLLIGIITLVIVTFLSFWLTRPMRRLLAYVRSVREGKQEPLPPLGSSEMGLLGDAIFEMQEKLEGKRYIEDYVRALTHEMKSPLTGIKGAGEILRDHVHDPQGIKFLNNIDTSVARMQNLIDRMLQLARLENARAITRTPIPIVTLLHEAATPLQAKLKEKNIHLDVQAPLSLTFYGDAFLLQQAMENIYANAVDFSPSGSVITATAVEQGDTLVITVQDQGTGMPDFAMEKAFDKFFSLTRPETQQKSTGLGLPFVKEIFTLHNGTVQLTNTHPGLEVRAAMPLR